MMKYFAMVLLISGGVLQGGELEFSGSAAMELRVFPEAPLYEGQSEEVSTSLVLKPEFYREF